MNRAIAAALLLFSCLDASATSPPALAPERYGHCFTIDSELSHYWSSTVFERDIAYGQVHAERERFQREFRAQVESQGQLGPKAQVFCELEASLPVLEESKKLKRNGFRFNRTEYTEVAWRPSDAVLPAPTAAATTASPADAGILAQLASVPAFALPAATGGSITRAGNSVSQPGSPYALEVALSSQLTRQPGNVCAVVQKVQVGGDNPVDNELSGLTWAGLITISAAGRMSSKDIVVDSQQHTTALAAGGAPLFPLVQGQVSTFTATLANTAGGTVMAPVVQQMVCTAGARGPASALVPGTAGEAVELACQISFPSFAGSEPRLMVFHWFSDAGCFVQDPTRG